MAIVRRGKNRTCVLARSEGWLIISKRALMIGENTHEIASYAFA